MTTLHEVLNKETQEALIRDNAGNEALRVCWLREGEGTVFFLTCIMRMVLQSAHNVVASPLFLKRHGNPGIPYLPEPLHRA